MAGRKRSAPATATRRGASASQGARSSLRTTRSTADSDVPLVVREMLAEAGTGSRYMTSEASERPLKRRRAGGRRTANEAAGASGTATTSPHPEGEAEIAAGEDEEDVEFEDVALPAPIVQTVYKDSDDEDDDDDEDLQFENVDFGAIDAAAPESTESDTLVLNLSEHMRTATPRRNQERRKPISKAEKERRVEIHKMHLLCLLSHIEKRNHWCNDPVVQESLRLLLTEKMITYLNPGENLSQFGRTESLKNGLKMASEMFRSKFLITERGLRRALWAEEEGHLQNYQLTDDVDSCLTKVDFRKAARALKGSRDVGAQLFCALLRVASVETRLVCSLQPLPFATGGPTLPKPRDSSTPSKMSKSEEYRARMPKYITSDPEPASGTPSPRRRLGHPNATGYNIPDVSTPSPSAPRTPPKTAKRIRESPFPVYWVEVLDEAHQKWAPVDPLVTNSQWKPAKFEPPASDRENAMCYVVAFEDDGSARDVTRRYAKAYNSKTRRMRIDGPVVPGGEPASGPGKLSGERWWRKAMRRYRRRRVTDLEQIEDHELAAAESREPMPRNVQDFKDHPVYALERHLRRHEVLRPGAQVVGTVGAGSRGPLEKIYRRSDVRMARSADKWYRLGRVIKLGESPVRVLPKQAPRKSRVSFGDSDPEDEDEEGEEEDPVLGTGRPSGTPLFTPEQTEPYVAPPVVDGRVPKNKFGNVEVFVASMVPPGGAHVRSSDGLDDDDDDGRAAHAASLLGVDYAPALTGFRFRGRKGTAVTDGVVVPAESAEAVRAVAAALGDLDAEAEAEARAARARRMWSRFLKGLRIRQRIWANVDPNEEDEEEEWAEVLGGEKGGDVSADMNHESVGESVGGRSGGFIKEGDGGFVDSGGGGFVDDGGGGGFVGDGAGGFIDEPSRGLVEDEGGGFVDDGAGGFVNEDHDGLDKGKGKAVATDVASDQYDTDSELENAPSDVTEEYYMEEDDEGGGFLVE
ncbi:Rad4-domain-containing protein [Pleurostoma richardsiae]|uniref:Rad4-domain-containing protein n=1 Tax=Pleurostoma richardsiae TaxID=41990 RepID=A0AA38RV45_9PEZI|nr:Rad4-domain-containing protein [Pleurostoma richardsiae]